MKKPSAKSKSKRAPVARKEKKPAQKKPTKQVGGAARSVGRDPKPAATKTTKAERPTTREGEPLQAQEQIARGERSHKSDHSNKSDSCAICRLRTLKAAAFAGDEEASGAIVMIAAEAVELVEALRSAGNENVLSVLRTSHNWPVMMTTPDIKRPWMTQLGISSSSLPISVRKFAYRQSLARCVLFGCFKILSVLRNLPARQQAEADALIANSKPASVPKNAKLRSEYYAHPDFMARVRHNIRSGVMPKHPEIPWTTEAANAELHRGLIMMAKVLQLSLSLADIESIVLPFLPKALALPPDDNADIMEWYAVAREMIFALTGGEPALNPVLRTMAPNNRGARKLNSRGRGNESLGETRTRIFELLEKPLESIRKQ